MRSSSAGIVFGIAALAALILFPFSQTNGQVGDLVKSSPLSTAADKNLLFGGCDTDPFEALKPFVSGGNVIPIKAGGALKNGIDTALACRLSKLLKFAQRNGCNAKIISGFRSAAQQESMCGAGRSGCAAPGKSCHQPGRDVDVHTH